jgi:Ca2+-binding EF-hand superfamily protein
LSKSTKVSASSLARIFEAQCTNEGLSLTADSDGRITKEELTTIMRDLGFPATEAQIDKMMKDADTNGNGSLDFEEFASAWKSAGGEEQE